ncbi:hypothetical protein Tco_0661875 [Tanacetum coccineum]
MPVAGSYSPEDVVVLNTRHTPIQKQPEALLCLVGLSRRYFLGDDVYPTFLNDDDRKKNWICLPESCAPNRRRLKYGQPVLRNANEGTLLIATATRVIAMEDATRLSSSSGTPSTVEKSPLDFSNEDSPCRITESDETENQGQETVAPEVPPQENVPTVRVTPKISLEKEVAAMGPLVSKKHHAAFHPTQSTIGEKSTRLDTSSTLSTPTLQETLVDVSDPDPLSYAKPQYANRPYQSRSSKGATVAGDPDSEKSTSLTSLQGRPTVAMGSQLRLREEEIKKLDQEIHSFKSADTELQGLRNQTKNLEALLEAEVDMKKAAEAKNVELAEELESLRAKFLDLQVNNTQLSQQVSSLQAQIIGEERIKAAFKEFKRYEDDKVEQRCAEMDARLDKLSIDFDEEMYPHMLTAIVGRRWLIGHGLRLAVLMCVESPEIRQAFADVVSAGLAKGMSEGLQYGIEHGKAGRDLGDVEAYDPEANDKFVKAIQDLKDLKYPIVDQLERLKDSPIDLIMAPLHLESDTGEDAPQWIRDLFPPKDSYIP